MARRTHVPKFGNWDANDHMPFTAVFDHARQGRGRPINPNDPAENPNIFNGAGRGNGPPRRPFNPNDPEDNSMCSHDGSLGGSSRDGSSRDGRGGGGGGSGTARRQVGAAGAPAQGNGMPSRAPPADPRRGYRENSVVDRSVESPSTSFSADQSPSHPGGNQTQNHNPAGRGSRLGGVSPAWEGTGRRKSTGEDSSPARSRLHGGRGAKDEGAGKGPSAALPKFGAWDAQDPGSGDGFTVIFNNARFEKKTGTAVNIPRTPDNNKSNDLYENQASGDYHKGPGAKKSWFCWCSSPEAKS